MIQHISAVTFAVRDMARSIEFYGKLGFELLYSSEGAAFSSLKAGEALVTLFASPGYERQWWGRAIFRVGGVGEDYRGDVQGLTLEPPQECALGRALLSHR